MEMSGSNATLPAACVVCAPAPSSTLLLQVPGIYHSKYTHYIFSKAGRQEAGGTSPCLWEVQGDAAGKEAGGKLIPGSRVEEGEVKMMNLGEHV